MLANRKSRHGSGGHGRPGDTKQTVLRVVARGEDDGGLDEQIDWPDPEN
jgi:hypothetical protein